MPSADRLARLFLLPLAMFVLAFFLLPLVRLVLVAGQGPNGAWEYLVILTNPRHLATLGATLVLSATVTLATLAIGVVVALFLGRKPLSRADGAGVAAHLAAGLSRRGGGLHGHPAGRAPGASSAAPARRWAWGGWCSLIPWPGCSRAMSISRCRASSSP